MRNLITIFVLLAGLWVGTAYADVAGEVVQMTGAATVQRGEDVLPVAEGFELHEGDTLVTHFETHLKAKMVDDAMLTLGPLSRLFIDSYVYDSKKTVGKALVSLTRGAMKTSTGYLAELSGHPFKVKTPIATIGIRGTEFFAGEYEGQFTIILLSGLGITLENEAGTVAITDIGHGTALAIAPTPTEGPPTDVLSAETAPLRDRLTTPLPPARQIPVKRLQAILGKVDY